MAASRDFSQAQWRLKLARAEHHFQEFERQVRTYSDRHPYAARRDREHQRDPSIWSYRLHIAEQPNDEIALVLGDVVHNVRAALDYLATALAPKGRRAFFPIEKMNIWDKNAAGEFIVKDDEARARFESAVRGMPGEAVAIIHELQPRLADVPELHPLAVLSKLENADKHRNLVPMLAAVRDVETEIFLLDSAPAVRQHKALCEDGAEVARFGFQPGVPVPPESEVYVHVCGSLVIAVNVGLKDGYIEIVPSLRELLDRVPIDVFASLEPFIQR